MYSCFCIKISIVFLCHDTHCFAPFWTFAVKLTGKLQNGTIFTQKGNDEEPYEFKIDEGNGILPQ